MDCWKSNFDLRDSTWADYRDLLGALPAGRFPDTGALNALLPPGTSNRAGTSIRFVRAADLLNVNYERHIFETGQVSTRENSWHDLFNALAWCRLPRLKAAMNLLHYQNLDRKPAGRRGRLRDALTLLDESGVIVFGSNHEVLNALENRDWDTAFIEQRESWGRDTRVLVCGHALLEKFLDPYKSLTGHALLLYAPGRPTVGQLDAVLGQALVEREWLKKPADLSPLPLMGIPGWWSSGTQDPAFYQDRKVFRPKSEGRLRAPIHVLPEISTGPDPAHMNIEPATPE